MKAFLFSSAVLFLCAAASSCSPGSDNPVSLGASHGSITGGSRDYWYSDKSGSTYIFSNKRTTYDASGNVVSTVNGPNDTVKTLGYAGFNSPNGDSMFYCIHDYRVLSSYDNNNQIDVPYVAGGLVDGIVSGQSTMYKRPRPVSTDTILAGVVGRVRTLADDFGSSGTYTWKSDTLYYAYHNGAVEMWQQIGTAWVMQREILTATPSTNDYWWYDLDDGASTTKYTVANDNTSVTVPSGSYSNCAEINITNSEIASYGFYHATKDFAMGVGPIKQHDRWTVTSDGVSFHDVAWDWNLISVH